MPVYCYWCKECGNRFEATTLNPAQCHIGQVYRDYKAEAAGFIIPSHMSSKNTSEKTDFLPSAAELAGPGDPDGAKALEKWNESFEPVPGNKSPQRPSRPAGAKKIFAVSDKKKA